MANRTENIIRIGAVRRETERAVFVEIDSGTFWLPRSQIEMYDNDTTFSIPKWLADEKGIT